MLSHVVICWVDFLAPIDSPALPRPPVVIFANNHSLMRNAFELLASGAKGKGSSKTPAGSKSSYATCPLCQRTVPLSFADAHVSVCLATPRPPPRSSSQQDHPSGSSPSPGLGASTPRAQLQAPQQLTPHPAASHAPLAAIKTPQQGPPQQQQQQPKQLLEGKQEGMLVLCDRAASGAGLSADAQPTANGPEEAITATPTPAPTPVIASPHALKPVPGTATHLTQSAAAQPATARQCRGDPTQQLVMQVPPEPSFGPSSSQGQGARPGQAAGTTSAFDIMRQSQMRAASRRHTFFLERTPGGRWLGHWWSKGCVTAAQQRLVGSSCWSVTLTVGLGPRVAAVASGGGGDGGSNGKETVVLLTNVPPGDGGEISWSSGGLPSNDLPPEGRWRGGPSVLKSALQKAVRLGRGSCAVRTALHLVKEDGGVAHLLRRLSVVCVEDAILHPGLPLVVWLMAAQAKGFVLGRAHGDALLPLVYQLAMVQVRDGLPDDPWDSGDPAAMGSSAGTALQGPATLQQVDEMALPALESCLVKCLLFRASYGGMGGDVRMMRAFAGYWAARFKSSAAQPPPPPGQPEGPPSRSTIGPPSAGLSETRPAPLDNAVGEGSEVRGNAHMTQEPAALAMAGCSSQATPGDVRVPDTYFATRLQAEDAPPSCTVFVPASQLLKEAVSEQCALRRLAAVAAARPISPAAAPPPPPPPPQPSPASCTSSADGIFPSYTQTSLTQQQYQPAAGDEVVRPRWHGVGQGDCMVHADAAVLASDSTSGGKGVDSSDQLSPWLAFLCNLYDQVTVPAVLATVASVGPMRRSDVPLSAVDFHVSDVITRLMERPELQALAPGADSGGGGGHTTPEDVEESLKSAMWLFRSSKNPKAWVHRLSPCCQRVVAAGVGCADASACPEHRSLEAQLTREDAARRRLEVLWTAAAPWADRFSVSFIARRFGPP